MGIIHNRIKIEIVHYLKPQFGIKKTPMKSILSYQQKRNVSIYEINIFKILDVKLRLANYI